MINEEVINSTVRQIIDTIVGPGYSIRARQNYPRPLGPYAAVDYISEVAAGTEENINTNNQTNPDITRTYSSLQECFISINFYREGAKDNARLVRASLARESSLFTLSEAGMGISSRSDVRDIGENIEGSWEQRAQFDLFLYTVGVDSEEIRTVQSLSIEASVQSGGNDHTSTIEVS